MAKKRLKAPKSFKMDKISFKEKISLKSKKQGFKKGW
jgi:hypothetical protein